ncbi:MAG: hypothetical protein N2Z79_04440 [Candidatus Omnitrophica bacterium]|nr:hypothetical protein [Candidatus Omnitrophota bacterium]
MIKRRRYIVNWRFQTKYILFGVLPIVILGILSISLLSHYARSLLIEQRQILLTQISTLESIFASQNEEKLTPKVFEGLIEGVKNLKLFTSDLLRSNLRELIRLNQTIFLTMILLVFGAVFFGVLYSHRIAGPIFRIQRLLLDLTQHIQIPIRVRKYDEFQDFFNAIDKLRVYSIEEKSRREKLMRGIAEKIEEIQKKILPEDIKFIEELKAEIDKLKINC